MRHENGLLIAVPRAHADRASSRRSGECLVLDASGDVVQWTAQAGPHPARGQTWRYWSPRRTGRRTVYIESAVDTDLSCECVVYATDGALRRSAVMQGGHCRPRHRARERESLHPEQGWLAHGVERSSRCRSLQQVLHGSLVVAADVRALRTTGAECWRCGPHDGLASRDSVQDCPRG